MSQTQDFKHIYPVISVTINQGDNIIYKYSYRITSPDGKVFPFGFFDKKEKQHPVEKLSNKTVEEYDWNFVLEQLRAKNAQYCDDCKNTTKMIVIVEDTEFFSNGLHSMFKENIQLVTRKEYDENTKQENDIVIPPKPTLWKRFIKWLHPGRNEQVTQNSFFYKNTNFLPLMVVGMLAIALAIFASRTPETPKLDPKFKANMVVTHSVTTIDTNNVLTNNTVSNVPIALNPVPLVKDTVDVDTVKKDSSLIAIFNPIDNRSPYQKMLDSLKGEKMHADSLAKFLRETRKIQIEFSAKISDGYTSRSVGTTVIVDSIRSSDITNMSIAINDMANNMARERAREIQMNQPVKMRDGVQVFASRGD